MSTAAPDPDAVSGGSTLSGLRALARDVLGLGRNRLASTAALVAGGGLAESFGLVLVIPLLALAAGPEGGAAGNDAFARGFTAALARLGIEGRLPRIGAVLGLFALTVVLRTVLVAKRELALTRLGSDYRTARQVRLANALGAAPWQRVGQVRHSAVTHVLGSEIHRLGHAATALLGVAVGAILVAVQLGLALLLDWRLTLVAAALLAAGAALGAPLLAGARRAGDATSTAGLTLHDDAGQFLGALKLAVGQNLQTRFVEQVGRSFATLARAEIGWIAEANRVRLRVSLLGTIVAAGTAFVGLGLLAVPAPRLLALLLVLSRLSGPLAQVQGQLVEAVRALPAFARVRALEAELGADTMPADPTPVPFTREIAFENVGFRHGADGPGLENISLSIPAGGFIGIAGPSGAGKTTLADLFVGLLAPDAGMIRVDGAPVDLARRSAWRDGLAYVAQDPFLRHESVRANLAWAVPGEPPSEAEMHDALRLVGADALVARMPGGLDAPLGERGSRVSGGERQRLAIARALLRKPRLLVLDEATNALDPAGEATLLEALDALRPALTIVMIAHRPTAFERCSRVYTIADGRLA